MEILCEVHQWNQCEGELSLAWKRPRGQTSCWEAVEHCTGTYKASRQCQDDQDQQRAVHVELSAVEWPTD